jgi:large subunit ribosomal protein L24
MIKKHMRKSQQYPQGQIVEREGSIHISNVMKAEDYDARVARHGTATPAPA